MVRFKTLSTLFLAFAFLMAPTFAQEESSPWPLDVPTVVGALTVTAPVSTAPSLPETPVSTATLMEAVGGVVDALPSVPDSPKGDRTWLVWFSTQIREALMVFLMSVLSLVSWQFRTWVRVRTEAFEKERGIEIADRVDDVIHKLSIRAALGIEQVAKENKTLNKHIMSNAEKLESAVASLRGLPIVKDLSDDELRDRIRRAVGALHRGAASFLPAVTTLQTFEPVVAAVPTSDKPLNG